MTTEAIAAGLAPAITGQAPGSTYVEDAPDPQSHVDTLQAEVITEAETVDIPDGAVAVPLAGTIVHITAPGGWTSSVNTALREGDWDYWAEEALVGDEFESIWCEMNNGRGPTNDQVTAMFEEWRRLTGNDPGKSRQSTRSLRRTGRR